jgi:hypothetical protein
VVFAYPQVGGTIVPPIQVGRSTGIDMSSQSKRDFPGFLSAAQKPKHVAIYALIRFLDVAPVYGLVGYCKQQGWHYTLFVDVLQGDKDYPRWRDLWSDISFGGIWDCVIVYQSIPGFSDFCRKHGVELIKLGLGELDVGINTRR